MALGGGGGGQLHQMMAGPSPPSRDWRDVFIMAVVTGTVGLTAISLVKSYLLPLIRPSSLRGLEGDKEEVKRQFDEAERRLEEMERDGKAVQASVQDSLAKVDGLVKDVDRLLLDVKTGEEQRAEEMKHLQDEVDEIRGLIPKLLDKNRTSQESSLSELQTELKSLKSLLINRQKLPASPSAPPSFISGRPQIPAWQLAAAAEGRAAETKAEKAEDKSNGLVEAEALTS